MKNLLIIFTLAIFLGNPSLSFAEVKSKIFPPTWEFDDVEFELKGTALKRTFFVRVFTAGFYLEKDVSPNDMTKDVPKRIETFGFTKIPREKLILLTEKSMRQNLTPQEFEALEERVVEMETLLVDLKPGDQLAITYIPEKGTHFEHNGKLAGIIEGEDFAKGFFSIWIGKKPIDPKLKLQIMGLAENRDRSYEKNVSRVRVR